MDEITVKPLSAKLESIVNSPVRFRIARLLVSQPNKEFTGREISRILRTSHSTVQQAMEEIVRSGLATRKVIGRANVFRANDESFIYQSLSEWFGIENKIQSEILNQLRSHLADVALSVVIFGSFARGTASERSDLDLLVIADRPEKAERNLASVESLFLRKFGLRVSPKILTKSDFLKKLPTQKYLQSALEEGIQVLGIPLRRVVG